MTSPEITKLFIELFTKVRDLVDAGWTQETFARKEWAGPGIHETNPEARYFCVMGACRKFTGDDHETFKEMRYLLSKELGGDSVAEWNDAKDRQKKDVVALIARVIERLKKNLTRFPKKTTITTIG